MKKIHLLPYAFRGVQFDFQQLLYPGRLVDRVKTNAYLGTEVHKQFASIFGDVLSAISENDREYLSQIMEKRLYNRTIQGIDQILDQKMKISYIENASENHEEVFDADTEESKESQEFGNNKAHPLQSMFKNAIVQNAQYKEKDIKVMIEAYGVFGARINREENQGKKVYEFRGRMTPRSYFLNPTNLMSLYYDQILSLNVYFMTTRKLYVTDQDGDLIHGEDTLEKEVGHIWKFETYSPNFDWVITDMDTFLDGNQYFKQLQEPKGETNKKDANE